MNFDGFFFGSLHFGYVQRYRNNEGKKNEDVTRYERVKFSKMKKRGNKKKIRQKFRFIGFHNRSDTITIFLLLIDEQNCAQ